MKKIAIMQPYFFPYLGYWQLIHAADCFVLFDDAQYIRRGWVNRNRILNPNGGWQYIVVPLKKHLITDPSKNVSVHPSINWKERIIGQLAHYKKKARYFHETNEIICDILLPINAQTIATINYVIINKMSSYLGLNKKIILSSENNFNYADVNDAGEWALRIAEQMNMAEYINPIAGAELFNRDKFTSSNIKLSFLKSHELVYSQRGIFESSLSIIDVLMFNGLEGTKEQLNSYSIE